MARADEGCPGEVDPLRTRPRPAWATRMICATFIPLAAFIGQDGHSVWREFAALRGEHVKVRSGALIGFININPNPSYATRPQQWIIHEGDRAKLWAGWDGQNHR